MFDLRRDFFWRTGCTVADVMKFMRQRIFKLSFSDGWVQVEKNRRVSGDIEHETILTRFDDWIDLSVDMCCFWKIGQRKSRRTSRVCGLPCLESFGQIFFA